MQNNGNPKSSDPFLEINHQKNAKMKNVQTAQNVTNHRPPNIPKAVNRRPQHTQMIHQTAQYRPFQNPYLNQTRMVHALQPNHPIHSSMIILPYQKMPSMVYHVPKPANNAQPYMQKLYQ